MKAFYSSKMLLFLLLYIVSCSKCVAYENPFLTAGAVSPDGKVGSFRQNNTGDCFFLASLIAMAQDPDGRLLLESAFKKSDEKSGWRIIFHNWLEQPVTITQQEFDKYELKNSAGDGFSPPVLGDPDVKLLEIAADKIWKNVIKPEGLWDDISMNAVFMFSSAEQLLIWNRHKAQLTSVQDIDKYQRIPGNIIIEQQVSSASEVEKKLRKIVALDHDGISMILIDYLNYHALAISEIDFIGRKYSFIGTDSNNQYTGDLNDLLQGVANGDFALDYIEIETVQ